MKAEQPGIEPATCGVTESNDLTTTPPDRIVSGCRLKAKFHYTDPTRTRTDPTEFRRKKSPCGSVRVRSGPCRVRVVEFSYN